MKNKKGFTLVELLVAIAIIGILSILGYALYSVAKRAARNTAREAALVEISGFIEEYENRYRKTPTGLDVSADGASITLMGVGGAQNETYELTPLSGITNFDVINTCTCPTVEKDELTLTYVQDSDFAVCLEPTGQKVIEGCESGGPEID